MSRFRMAVIAASFAWFLEVFGVAVWRDQVFGAEPVSGTATWYATGPGRGEAAAGGELRTGDWRGRRVQVCADRCVIVRLSDWCACGGNRIIDLSDEDFASLAPLSAGVIHVTVSQLGVAATPPATSTIPEWAGARPGWLPL